MNISGKVDPFVIIKQKEQMTAIPAQATLPPVPEQPQPTALVSQPQRVQYVFNPPPVFETNDTDDSNEFDRETLICDEENEHMVLITTKEKRKFKHTESPDVRFGVHVNNRHSVKRNTVDKILSNGCVRLIRVYCPTDEHGNKFPLQCEVEVVCRDSVKRLSVPVDAIRRKDKSVKDTFAKAGIGFIDNGFKLWCEKFTDQINKANVHTVHMGFYKDENDRWCHVFSRRFAT